MADGFTEEDLILRIRVAGARAAQASLAATRESVLALGRAAKSTTGAADQMGRAFKRGGSKMRETGYAMTRGITAPIMLLGGAATKMALDFDQQMTLVQTQAGASAKELRYFRRAVLALAPKTTQGPQELARALFHLRSVGLKGAAAMNALKISAQGATVGNANLEETSTALGSIWRVNIKESKNLHSAMAILNATVGAGNMRFSDLIHSLGTGIMPVAKRYGLNLLDIAGATAVFTDEGYKASSATTQLATALHYFTAPGAKSIKTLRSMGLSVSQLAADFLHKRGLRFALADLQKHLNAAGAAGAKFVKVNGKLTAKNKAAVREERLLGNILPGGRGRIFLVLLNQLETYNQKMNQILDTQRKFDHSVKQSMETPLNRLKTALSSIKTDLIGIGEDIIPIIVPLFDKFAHSVHKLTKRFKEMTPEHRSLIIKLLGVAAVMGPVITFVGFLSIAIGGLTTGLMFLVGSPVGLFMVFLTAAALGLYTLYGRSTRFRHAVNGVGHALVAVAKSGKHAWKELENTIANVWNNVKFLFNRIADAHNFFHPHSKWKHLGDAHFGSHWDKKQATHRRLVDRQTLQTLDRIGHNYMGPLPVGHDTITHVRPERNRNKIGVVIPHDKETRELLKELVKHAKKSEVPPTIRLKIDGREVATTVERQGRKIKSTR